MHGVDVHIPVAPPGEAVAVYPVMVAPPSELGAVNATVAVPSPADADVMVGWVGATAVIVKVTSFVPES